MVMNWEALSREVAEMREQNQEARPGRRKTEAEQVRDNQERERRQAETQEAKVQAHHEDRAEASRKRNAELDAQMPAVIAALGTTDAEHRQLCAEIDERLRVIAVRHLELNALLNDGFRPGKPLPNVSALIREREDLAIDRRELEKQRARIQEIGREARLAARRAIAPAMKEWAAAYTSKQIAPKATRALKSLETFLDDLTALNDAFAPLAHANGRMRWVGPEWGFHVHAGPFGPLSPNASLANITAALRGQCAQGVE